MSDELVRLAADAERAKHVIVKQYRQPGEGYRLEARCRCGWDGFASEFPEHRARAALDAGEAVASSNTRRPEEEL